MIAELSAAGRAVPATLADIVFTGQPASIVFTSAEGVTTFGGAEADTDGSTRRWLDDQFERLGKTHETVNKPLKKLREKERVGASNNPSSREQLLL
jgi:hypothetical protein